MKVPLALYFCLIGMVAHAQNSQKLPAAPVLPRSTAEVEKTALIQTELGLSKSRFAQALEQIAPLVVPPVTRIYVDWTPVPAGLRPAYHSASDGAIRAWNAAMAGTNRFEAAPKEDKADVVILFEQSVTRIQFGQNALCCLDGVCEPDAPDKASAPRRTARIRISIREPFKETAHSAASMSHLFGQAIGLFLGLKPSTDMQDIMGPDMHVAPVAAPSLEEATEARDLQAARLRLLDYARRRIQIYLPRAILVVEKMEVDAGNVWRGDTPHYVFQLKNKGDAPLEIDAQPKCGCTVAHYDRTIAPGAAGRIEADLRTADFRGRVVKLIEVTTNDPENAKFDLHLNATVKSVVSIQPTEAPILSLKEQGTTTHEMRVEIADTESVKITRALCSAPYATAAVEPVGDGGKNSYNVTVTVQPNAPSGRSVFMVTLVTTSKREPQTTVLFTCEKGILVQPSTVYMGTISSASVLPIHQIVTLSRRGNPFHIKKITLGDKSVQTREETVQEGQQYRVFVTYIGGWQPGSLQRKIVVETDDPARPVIEILLTANVAGDGDGRK